MTPIVAYLLVLDGVLVASWVGWWFVRRAADQAHQLAASVALAASAGMIKTAIGTGRSITDDWSTRYLDHAARADGLERVAGWMRVGVLVLSSIVLLTAAVVLLP